MPEIAKVDQQLKVMQK